MNLTTYSDLTQHCIDYLGGATDAENERAARRAVQMAYQDLPTRKRWSYYIQEGRLATVAPYTTGTVVFDYSGGAHERMLTLTTGTWPTWAARGVVLISSVYYQVASRVSDSIITLNQASNPGADVSSTTYELYRDVFTLPCDFQSMGELVIVGESAILDQIHPNDWLKQQRIYHGSQRPRFYTITGDPDFFGSMALRLYPFPDAAYNLAYLYTRLPRALKFVEEATGTVSTTSGSTTVTGSGTAFTSAMVGSVIRFSNLGTGDKPTGRSGASPYHLERVISAYTSATSITVDSDPGETLTSVLYTVSDPADIEPGSMTTLLLRESERQARLLKRMKPNGDEDMQYQQALHLAFEADSRHFSSRQVGQTTYRQRLADMPITFA